MTKSYNTPVSKLLSYGSCKNFDKWPNYLELGFTKEHIPELIKMATDEALQFADSESLEVWAPVHAWRALGQLKAEEAILPFLSIFWLAEDGDEWIMEEMPDVMAMIGINALDPLVKFIRNQKNGLDARVLAGQSIEKIGEKYPEKRDECIEILTEQLAKYTRNSNDFNGFMISYLVSLKAVSAIEVIRKAYELDCVEYFINGDLEDVEIHLGLKEERTKKPNYKLVNTKKDNIFSTAEKILAEKIGRNDPCLCGSGKKYKKCCLNKKQ